MRAFWWVKTDLWNVVDLVSERRELVQDHAYLRPEEPDRQDDQEHDDGEGQEVDGFLPTGLCDQVPEDDKLSDDLPVGISGSHGLLPF